MSKEELVDYANENGIEGVSESMRKAKIISVIENAENAEG